EIVGDGRRERHPVDDVALDIDTRRDLGEHDALLPEFEDGPLGDEDDRLVGFERVVAAEGDLLDALDELRRSALALDGEPSVADGHRGVAGRERATEDHLRGVLGDVDEPTTARQPRAEPADVDVAVAVGLCDAEIADIESAPVVEVELLWRTHERVVVAGGPEVDTAGRRAADGARFHSLNDLVADAA